MRGAKSGDFIYILKEHIGVHRPKILALLEMHVSGSRVDEVYVNIVY